MAARKPVARKAPRRVQQTSSSMSQRAWEPLVTGQQPLAVLYEYGPMKRIAVVREGVPARLVDRVAGGLGLSKEKLYAAIGVARATVDRKIREGRRLNADESERLLGLARLIGQVDRIVHESADAEVARNFDAARWLGAWLDEPNPALGGERPAALLDTADGRELVGDLIASMQSGTYM